MKNYLVFLWQIVTYFFIGIPLRVLYRVKVNYDFEFEEGKKYVIASNHPNRVDPFLVSYSFPFSDFIRFLPFRFITADIYMKMIIIAPVLLIYGCITSKETRKGKVLHRSVDLLNRGESVYIFPSGTLERKQGKKYDARIGVAYLGSKVKDCKIIPVHLDYSKKKHNGVIITYKKAIKVNSKVKDLQKEADKIYKECLKI